MICWAVTPCRGVSMTSTAVVLGTAMPGTPEAAPDSDCATDVAEFSCAMMNVSSFRTPAFYASPFKPGESEQGSRIQCPQRHQRPNRDVLVIHQLFLRQRQRFHNRSCLVLGLHLHQKDDAFAIAARIPLADFPVQVELDSCPNLFRYNGHDLLRGYTLSGGLNHQHCRGLGYGYAGHGGSAAGL